VKEGAGLDERDAYWVRKDSIDMPFPDCPNIKKLKSRGKRLLPRSMLLVRYKLILALVLGYNNH